MPSIKINGAELYYETFGKDTPRQAPVLLIHGSTGTGRSNWSLAAPLLARHRYVIVPDCRGHGQSSNPGLSYSFKEMADDMAALVRALGFPKAHIIGHSNGGNVALVMLVEHPEVVQTAILQAANAYVSTDLLEKEPSYFDPERVEKQDQAWMKNMIALHGAAHGTAYWRDLLRLTLQETISAPNYTPDDLAKVQLPTLVIQGENDRTNAPARHGQFIAGYIPLAELWLPAGAGHTVHDDMLFAWIERVESFLERRGSSASESLHRLHKTQYAETRETVFEVKADTIQAADKPASIRLSGRVLFPEQRQAAQECVETENSAVDASAVQVLFNEETPWALVKRPVDDLRREPRSLSERVSQVLLGEAVCVLETRADWAWVRTVQDNYPGWVHASALHFCPAEEAAHYKDECQAKVFADLLPGTFRPGPIQEQILAGKLPFGANIKIEIQQDGLAQLHLPDRRLWWVEASGLLFRHQFPKPDAAGIAFMLKRLQRLVGVPYLWGGRTPYGYDCSGLAQAFFDFLGVNLPRDADQQYRCGQPVEGRPQPGDLLFFGEQQENNPSQRYASITHVAISLGDDEILHANGPAWSISYNSLNSSSPLFRGWLRDNLIGIRRYV